jgi:tetratricopeptide (TPR) repeat protein
MMRGRRVAVGAVLAVALALRLAHWAAVRRLLFVAGLVMDSAEYDRWAREIAAGDWLGSGVFFQAPLYPYLVAVLYLLFGPHADAVYLTQIACAVAGCYALYRAGRLMAGEGAALAAAALAAVYGPFIFYDVQLLKESLAVDVTAFLLWALAAARQQEGPAPALSSTPLPPPAPALEMRELTRPAGMEPATTPAGGSAHLTRWLIAGLLLGVLSLLRENALLTVPLLLPLAWPGTAAAQAPAPSAPSAPGPERRGARWAGFVLRAGALLLGVALALAPVAWRNGRVGGDYLPTTSQGGVNFYIGNNARADGTYRPIVPGKQTPWFERLEPLRIARQESGRPLSPGEASRFWLGKALRWAAAHPGDWLRLQLAKLAMFWSWYEWPDAVDYYFVRGLSPVFRLPLLEFGGATLLAAAGLLFLARGHRRAVARMVHTRPAAEPEKCGLAPALLFLAAWTLSTVAFFLFSRYRLPAVPPLLLLAGLPVAAVPRAFAAWRAARLADAGRGAFLSRRPVLSLAVLCALLIAAFALPRAAGYAPRLDLVHYNLGRLEAEAGHAAAARGHYQEVVALDPGNFLAWLNLGSMAARERDWDGALACFGRAAALAPDSDDAQSNLGGVLLALGRLDEAGAHLDRALALDADNPQALQNAALLRLRRGDRAGAAALNRRLLALQPANPAALRLRERLAAGR